MLKLLQRSTEIAAALALRREPVASAGVLDGPPARKCFLGVFALTGYSLLAYPLSLSNNHDHY